jgi:Flp pilus assembly protein TadG
MKLRTLLKLARDRRGNAAAEMAMVAPLLLILMFGCVELGNYFWNEHSLLKAVRDGARFAARQGFSNYSTCSSTGTDLSSSTVGSNTKTVVQKGSLDSTQPDLLPNWSTATFTLTATCDTAQVGGQSMSGLYKNNANGWAKVTVQTTLTYRPVLAVALGFSGVGYQLSAQSQAAVTGI